MSPKRDVIKFFCGVCEQKLSVPTGLEGQKFSCPNCQAPGHVPGMSPADVAGNHGPVVKFFCQHCGQKLSCEARNGVREVRCPVCRVHTSVPQERGREPGGGTAREQATVSRSPEGIDLPAGPPAVPSAPVTEVVSSLEELGFDVARFAGPDPDRGGSREEPDA